MNVAVRNVRLGCEVFLQRSHRLGHVCAGDNNLVVDHLSGLCGVLAVQKARVGGVAVEKGGDGAAVSRSGDRNQVSSHAVLSGSVHPLSRSLTSASFHLGHPRHGSLDNIVRRQGGRVKVQASGGEIDVWRNNSVHRLGFGRPGFQVEHPFANLSVLNPAVRDDDPGCFGDVVTALSIVTPVMCARSASAMPAARAMASAPIVSEDPTGISRWDLKVLNAMVNNTVGAK